MSYSLYQGHVSNVVSKLTLLVQDVLYRMYQGYAITDIEYKFLKSPTILNSCFPNCRQKQYPPVVL